MRSPTWKRPCCACGWKGQSRYGFAYVARKLGLRKAEVEGSFEEACRKRAKVTADHDLLSECVRARLEKMKARGELASAHRPPGDRGTLRGTPVLVKGGIGGEIKGTRPGDWSHVAKLDRTLGNPAKT